VGRPGLLPDSNPRFGGALRARRVPESAESAESVWRPAVQGPLPAGAVRPTRSWTRSPEAPPGFEPGIKDLQSSALPLGHGARYATGAVSVCCRPLIPRAGNRTRTGDPNLGKVVLYQLSYSRIELRQRS
jgi:hypothetical protein